MRQADEGKALCLVCLSHNYQTVTKNITLVYVFLAEKLQVKGLITYINKAGINECLIILWRVLHGA